eukprot:UN08747
MTDFQLTTSKTQIYLKLFSKMFKSKNLFQDPWSVHLKIRGFLMGLGPGTFP